MRPLAQEFGLAGMLAVGTALFCAVFYAWAIQPLERELDLRRSATAGATRAAATVVAHPAEDLSRLHARFPSLEKLPAEVERLHRLGRSAGLQLHQAEYRLELPPAGLASYRVSLPVRGDYPTLRRFISMVLQEMPIASIDRLRFERKKPGEAQLDAQIQLTLFFRPPNRAEIQ